MDVRVAVRQYSIMCRHGLVLRYHVGLCIFFFTYTCFYFVERRTAHPRASVIGWATGGGGGGGLVVVGKRCLPLTLRGWLSGFKEFAMSLGGEALFLVGVRLKVAWGGGLGVIDPEEGDGRK